MVRVSRQSLLAVTALSACCAAGAAFAQAPAPAAAADSAQPAQLADIVVTAEKRETTAQRTPIAMSVLTPEVLTRNGVGSLQDLTQIAPSVSFSAQRTNAIVTIRGISSRDTTEIGDPAVSISVDGFYYQRSIGLNDSVFDLERVEVLRGPQGTLYGRNATGGAINFITAKPIHDFAAYVRGGYGSYNQITTEGMVNMPINDWAALRASFATRSHDGYRHNAPSADGDDADAKSARLHLLLTPTPRLSVLLTGEVTRLGGVGPTIVGAPIVLDRNGQVVHERPLMPENRQDFPLNTPNQFVDSNSRVFRGDLDYDFGAAKLTYLFGYRKLDFTRLSDFDGVAAKSYDVLSDEHLKTFSHELRLSSKAGGPLQWQTGLFYFEEKNNLYSTVRGFPVVASNTTAQVAAFMNYFRYPYVDLNSRAAFLQGSYQLTSQFKIEGGIRYTLDHKKRWGMSNTTTSGALTAQCDMGKYGLMPCPNAFVNQYGKSRDARTTYHAALNWQATANNLLYVKYDTGFKSGGFSDVVVYGPESLRAYEAGAKNRFFENRLQVNVAGYYYDYTDQQINQLIQGRTQTVNAGKSEIYGLEVEGTAILSANDRLDGSVSYLHARFTDLSLASGSTNVQLAGNRPPQSPTWSFSLGYEHDFHVFNGVLTPRLQTHVESESFFQVQNYNSDRQPSYMRSDVIATYRPDGGRWTLMAYMRNIENTAILAFAQERAPFGTYIYQYEAPRTYGAEIRYNF